MEFTEGKIVELNHHYETLNGLRVKMIRVSRKTGNYTVEAQETREGVNVGLGERLHVQAYQLREVTKRQEELEREYVAVQEDTKFELKRFVERGRVEREKIARQILTGSGYLTDAVKWGSGVESDIVGQKAEWALANIEEHGLETVLGYLIEESTRDLLQNRFHGGSSNQYSNAVEGTRAEAARKLLEWAQSRRRWLAKARADVEIL